VRLGDRLQPPLDTRLPHFYPLQRLSYLLEAYAAYARKSGPPDEGAQAAMALVRMGRHVGGKSVFEYYYALVLVRTASEVVQQHASAWSPSARAEVLAVLEEIDKVDPLNGEANLASEMRAVEREGAERPSLEYFRESQRVTLDYIRDAIQALQ